jgi:hypothetical protein
MISKILKYKVICRTGNASICEVHTRTTEESFYGDSPNQGFQEGTYHSISLTTPFYIIFDSFFSNFQIPIMDSLLK